MSITNREACRAPGGPSCRDLIRHLFSFVELPGNMGFWGPSPQAKAWCTAATEAVGSVVRNRRTWMVQRWQTAYCIPAGDGRCRRPY